MSTGVVASDALAAQFNELKLGRISTKFIIYKINGPQIETDRVGEEGENFDQFLTYLPLNECRYAVYDLDFTTNDGRPAKKLVSITWAPDSAKVKDKMVYAGSKDALNRALVGVATKVSATDRSEITEAILIDAARKFA